MRAQLTDRCVGLQNGMDLGETVPSVCTETCLTVCGDGSEVSDMRTEGVLDTRVGGSFSISVTSSKGC